MALSKADKKFLEEMIAKKGTTEPMRKMYKNQLALDKDADMQGIGDEIKKNESKTKKVIKKALKKKPTKKKVKVSEKDITALKKQIKQKTGKTEAECIAIVEQYKSLRGKAQKRKKSAEKSNKKVAKETKQGKRIAGKKTASTLIRETTKKTAPIINKEIDKIGIKEETDKLFKETKILVESIKVELSKYDKDAGKDYLMRVRKEIDKLLRQKYGGGGFTAPSNIQAGMISVGNNTNFEEGGEIFDGSGDSVNFEKGGSIADKKHWYFNDLGDKLDIDINNMVQDWDDVNSYDELEDVISENGGFDQEVIYYGTAMEYLTNHDTSLTESLELAGDMGFECKNLNSETLASILKTQNVREEFSEQRSEIEEFFEQLESGDSYGGGGFTTPSNIQAGMISVGNNSHFEEGGEIFDGSGDSVNFAKGGMMQGYNDRADEGLGMRRGRDARYRQNYKGRRDEMKGENRAVGNRTYGSFARGGMTISKIKELSSETSPHFFDRKSLKFFGQTMRDFKVSKMEDGRYKIFAPSYTTDYASGERRRMGDTVRYFNPDNNELERS